MSVYLTEAAATHVARMLEQRGHGIGLRVATKKSGCSGFAYVVDYAEAVEIDDEVFESYGIRVVVDKASLERLDGTEIDFVKTNALNRGFEFRNPNIRNTCGCGESFSL
jgi:iron-sulfur cluster assembly protein